MILTPSLTPFPTLRLHSFEGSRHSRTSPSLLQAACSSPANPRPRLERLSLRIGDCRRSEERWGLLFQTRLRRIRCPRICDHIPYTPVGYGPSPTLAPRSSHKRRAFCERSRAWIAGRAILAGGPRSPHDRRRPEVGRGGTRKEERLPGSGSWTGFIQLDRRRTLNFRELRTIRINRTRRL
jgi:hypothetical protein